MAARHKGRFGDNVNLVNDYPPSSYQYGTPSKGPRWHPRSWSRRARIGVAIGTVVLIIVIVVAAVLGSRANRYPSYTKLDYALRDT
jgi:hypothetical protein